MNRAVVITGASSGLGLSLAKRFIDQGDTVYGVSLTKRNWSQAKAEIASQNRKLFHLRKLDVSHEASVKGFFLTLLEEEVDHIDVLVNNAGYAEPLTRLEKETLRQFQKHLSVNLIGTFLMCKYALPIFRKQNDGWIVNVSSYAGKRAVPGLSAYSASKFGVAALTQTIARENASSRFKCVTVCPGGMNTRMRLKLFGREDAARQQSPDFVADQILKVLDGEIEVPSGGDIVIRHGKVVAVNPPPHD